MAIDYVMKWVEMKALQINIVVVTFKFMYEYIFIQFGCPLQLIINQCLHFINKVIQCLIEHFLLKHTNSIVYYL
jgi:hypothetical protein